jgi:hypothetical protein
MKYKLGDFVRFVDENMEGYVTRIHQQRYDRRYRYG